MRLRLLVVRTVALIYASSALSIVLNGMATILFLDVLTFVICSALAVGLWGRLECARKFELLMSCLQLVAAFLIGANLAYFFGFYATIHKEAV